MNTLTLEQRVEIILSPKRDEGYVAICTHFNQKYPNVEINRDFVGNLIRSFKENGHILNHSEKKSLSEKRINVNQDEIDQINHTINQNPHVSIERISNTTNINKSKIRSVLKSQKFHPYKLTILQEILPRDYPTRYNFCSWIKSQQLIMPNFSRSILFSDEANFHVNGTINTQNYRLTTFFFLLIQILKYLTETDYGQTKTHIGTHHKRIKEQKKL